MQNDTQISAFISIVTKERLERYAEARGLKKGAVIEAALLHHLQALDELPLDIVVPARLLVGAETLARMTGQTPAPTATARALAAGERVDAPESW